MIIISHRRNTIDELKSTPRHLGVEVDIRSFGNKLVINHDPYQDGLDFEMWLTFFSHGTLILNVKEEGLESRLLDLMKSKGINDFFFLDQSFPFLVKWANLGESRSAVRVSEYESIDTALNLAGKVEWVWLDCFKKLSIDSKQIRTLKNAGFKICLVSPELHSRDYKSEVSSAINWINEMSIEIDAVCTKYPEIWGGS